jgi:PTS system ascorbate-specific IIC component
MDVGLIFAIVPRLLPAFMLALVALVGLLIQRKSFSDTIRGTVKTMAGVLILFIGVDIIVAVIDPITTLFGKVYAIEGAVGMPDWTVFLGEYAVEIVLAMVLGFLVNLLIARITKFKYVFLTGHILFWYAFTMVGALADGGEIQGTLLWVVAGVLLGIWVTLLTALAAPFVKKLIGSDEFVIGHSTTFLAWLAAVVGKYTGDPSDSTEDIEFSSGWMWLREMVISTSLIMFLVYLIFGFIAGVPWAAEQFVGGTTWLWYLWIIFQGIMFGAGRVVLLTGVRMMLAEIVPAFRGIAMKVVPDAVPALDCPMVFPYGQNALAIGFPIAMVTSLITLVVFGVVGWKYVLVPMVVAAFFDAGPGAVLANATGGRRGVIFGSIAAGIMMVVLQAFGMTFVANTAGGFVQAFGGNDVGLMSIIVGGIARLLGF